MSSRNCEGRRRFQREPGSQLFDEPPELLRLSQPARPQAIGPGILLLVGPSSSLEPREPRNLATGDLHLAYKLVARTVHGLEVERTRRVLLKLLPQPENMIINGPR